MIDIRFHPEAERELDEAAEWFDARRPGVGKKLIAAVHRATTMLRNHPQAGPQYEETIFRKWVLIGTPYILFYEDRGDEIEILAVAHHALRPGYWMDRSREKR